MMTDAAPDFARLVPGFDFLQDLVKNAGSVLPSMGQWVAPTLDPEELEKRIEELRTVQFWLEQNARMLSATIQALEVQRMTLSTLQTMNVQVADLRESLRIKLPADEQSDAAASASRNTPGGGASGPRRAAAASDGASGRGARRPDDSSKGKAAGAAPAGMVDPMQWWGALTQQFTQLAAHAMKDGAAPTPKTPPPPQGPQAGAARPASAPIPAAPSKPKAARTGTTVAAKAKAPARRAAARR
jgi:hypothetical protein